MFTHIMVPLDGSELAERALPTAERLAAATGATLHLVRVVDLPQTLKAVPPPVYLPDNLFDEIMAWETNTATTYLAAVRERVAREAHVTAQAQQLSGDTAASLLDYELAAGIDLVVLCSRGHSGLTRFALGSIAERLLRHSPVPILLVRVVDALVTLDHALVPLDGSERAEEALTVCAHLAHDVDLVRAVTLLRVIETPDQRTEAERYEAERYLEGAERRLRTMGFPEQGTCTRRVEQGHPAQVIIDMAGTDALIVMASHGRAGWTRWMLGSVAERVAHHGTAKVLLLRHETVQQRPAP